MGVAEEGEEERETKRTKEASLAMHGLQPQILRILCPTPLSREQLRQKGAEPTSSVAFIHDCRNAALFRPKKVRRRRVLGLRAHGVIFFPSGVWHRGRQNACRGGQQRSASPTPANRTLKWHDGRRKSALQTAPRRGRAQCDTAFRGRGGNKQDSDGADEPKAHIRNSQRFLCSLLHQFFSWQVDSGKSEKQMPEAIGGGREQLVMDQGQPETHAFAGFNLSVGRFRFAAVSNLFK